jgi:hypothetical protein
VTDLRIDRPAEPEELCTCGRQALVVINAGPAGLVGWCGQEDADREGPCPFCGGPRHQGICPRYRLRLDAWAGGVEGRVQPSPGWSASSSP